MDSHSFLSHVITLAPVHNLLSFSPQYYRLFLSFSQIKLKEALRTIDDQTVIIDLAREEQEDFDKKNQVTYSECRLSYNT